MKKSYRLYHVDAFTRALFAGNPAGVIANADGLTEHQMQLIAREMNLSETAFIFSPSGDDHDVHVRFFTPTVEVPLCGHATVAAHFVRSHEGMGDAVSSQLTGAGVLAVEVETLSDGERRVWMAQRPAQLEAPLCEGHRSSVLSALGLGVEDVPERLPIQIVSTGHSKVMVPLRHRKILQALRPDLQKLATLSKELGCNGYFPFTLDNPEPGAFSHGRMFAPAIGIPEDPVTGNANGPLGAYLLSHGVIRPGPENRSTFCARQGDEVGRPGSVLVEVSRSADDPSIDVRIAGEAVIVFQTAIEVEGAVRLTRTCLRSVDECL